jgi:hypothetical protein
MARNDTKIPLYPPFTKGDAADLFTREILRYIGAGILGNRLQDTGRRGAWNYIYVVMLNLVPN